MNGGEHGRITIESVRGIAAIGGWVIVSLFLMSQAAGFIPSVSDRLRAEVEAHEQSSRDLAADLKAHRIRQENLIERLTIGLRVICENSARMPFQSNNCANIR
jgi:hypothetical protein